MQNYINQLLSDIDFATANIRLPFIEKQMELHEWICDEEENLTAPTLNLQEWTGITQEMLPPAERLTNEQINQLLDALKKMLDAYNRAFVLQTQVPENIQYQTIRHNFNQQAKIKQWHPGFFAMCKPGTPHNTCSLRQYCQCAFYAELFSGFIDEVLTPEEEKARELEIEINHLRKKHGDNWMKYYPYHLDAAYDDENGKPYNYGIDDPEEDNNDNWWRK
jgi:hypothetical protein